MREIMLTHSTTPARKAAPFLAFFTNSPSSFALPHALGFASGEEARTASVAFANHNLGWQPGTFTINDRI